MIPTNGEWNKIEYLNEVIVDVVPNLYLCTIS